MAAPKKAGLPSDEKLLDTAVSVGRRYHRYHGYGQKEKKAVAAFQRRAPGFSDETYVEVLAFFGELFTIASASVRRYPSPPKGKYCKFEDIDWDRCMEALEKARPGYATRQKNAVLSWTVLYDYLM